MEKQELKRECPKCGKELIYKSKDTFRNANKVNGLCRNCAGLKRVNENNERSSDLSILLNDSNETFYWIGFILADGCFFEDRLQITLAIKDKDHLQNFANYVKYNIPLKDTKTNTTFSSKNIEICPLICEKFDIKANKTYNPPKTIKTFTIDQQYCLLAGFIDGDGNIQNQRGGRKDYFLRIKNHSSWEHILKEFNELIYNQESVKINNQGYAELNISNTEILKSLKRKVEEYNLPIMIRKWDIIDYSFESKLVASELLKENVLKDLELGMKTKDIAIKYNAGLQNIYRIKRNYYVKK